MSRKYSPSTLHLSARSTCPVKGTVSVSYCQSGHMTAEGHSVGVTGSRGWR